jgi:hypothetical protein
MIEPSPTILVDAQNYQLGLNAMHSEDWRTAASILSQEPESSGYYAPAMANLAQAYLALGRGDDAWPLRQQLGRQ